MKRLPELIQQTMSSGGNHTLKELRDNEKLHSFESCNSQKEKLKITLSYAGK